MALVGGEQRRVLDRGDLELEAAGTAGDQPDLLDRAGLRGELAAVGATVGFVLDIVQAAPGSSCVAGDRPGSEFEGWTVGLSFAPNWTGAEAQARAGAIIAAASAGERGNGAGAAGELRR